jgi:hypothetical protein
MHFICITDKSVLEKNYIFVDELAVSQSHWKSCAYIFSSTEYNWCW